MDTNRPTGSHDNEVSADAADEGLLDDDLEQVAGGGIVMDAYDVLQASWGDIKQGFSDAYMD